MMSKLAMLLAASSFAQNPAPILPTSTATMVTYYLKNSTAVAQYLELLEPLVEHVTDNEAGTLTFRPFISHELSAVRLVVRFANASASEALVNSPAHVAYLDSVAMWNKTTGYLVRKEKGHWDELAWGAFSKSGESGEPAGYSQEVTYYMRDTEALEYVRNIQYPVALYTVWQEPWAQTYSPFVSHETFAYRLLCRYNNYSSYADIHRSSPAHLTLMDNIHAYKKADPDAIVSIEKGAWNETAIGFLERQTIIV